MPKEPSTRRRPNKRQTFGARTLAQVPKSATPPLPEGRVWHPMTVAWWGDVWGSPMSAEYDTSDRNGLYLLAVLVDAFWCDPSKELAAEIRLQRQCFGLTPLDRRRLQWEIERGEQAEQKRAARAAPSTPRAKGKSDPRRLAAVG
jgi:hypothetical protein